MNDEYLHHLSFRLYREAIEQQKPTRNVLPAMIEPNSPVNERQKFLEGYLILPLVAQKLPLLINLPIDFPNTKKPRFEYGSRLRWLTLEGISDWGVVFGRFYNYASHRRDWMWCYLIWLDEDSPSAVWVTVDVAWETDLDVVATEM